MIRKPNSRPAARTIAYTAAAAAAAAATGAGTGTGTGAGPAAGTGTATAPDTTLVLDPAPMTSPSPAHLDLCVSTTLALPSAAACNLRLLEQSPGRAICRLDVTEAVCAGTGALSGGDLYGLLDSIAYLALITLLPDDETGVSHDAHFSLLSMAPLGTDVEVRSEVQKRGRNLAFIRVEAFVLGGDEPKPLALATVTKSIISMKQRLRHRPRG